MIKINLAKRRKSQGSKGGNLFGIQGLKAGNLDVNSLKDIDWKRSPLTKLLVAGLGVYLLEGQLVTMKQEKLQEEDARIAAAQGELDDITKKLGKVRGYEPLKKQLEDDERNIQTKLSIIASLMENKDAPSKLLRQFSQIMPEEVWIDSLSVENGRMALSGGSTSYNLVSDFMKNLNDSSLFSNVSLSQISEAQGEGLKSQRFDISALTKGI